MKNIKAILTFRATNNGPILYGPLYDATTPTGEFLHNVLYSTISELAVKMGWGVEITDDPKVVFRTS